VRSRDHLVPRYAVSSIPPLKEERLLLKILKLMDRAYIRHNEFVAKSLKEQYQEKG